MEKVVWIKISKRVQKLLGSVSIWYSKVAPVPTLPYNEGIKRADRYSGMHSMPQHCMPDTLATLLAKGHMYLHKKHI
jgi:hypothetical protein